MKILSLRLLFAVTAAASTSFQVAKAAPGPDAPCIALSAHARGVTTKGWMQGVEKAMAPTLVIDKERNPNFPKGAGDPFEQSLTELPWVRTALYNDNGDWSEFVSRLAGRDIYMVSTYQGTLHCQSAVFIRAPEGAEPKSISAPTFFQHGDGDSPCWTQSGKLGAVDGQPAFIEGGADSDHTFDASYEIAPWTGEGWGKGCKLTLRFRTEFELERRHCADKELCRAAADVVVDVAKAYDAFRRTFNGIDKTAFVFGAPDTQQRAALHALVDGLKLPEDLPIFPRFGDADQTQYGGSFSYSCFQYTPLHLAGHWYVAAIGHEGVGWRESGLTLIAIYDVSDGKFTPRASFEVQAVNGGLIEAKVAPGA